MLFTSTPVLNARQLGSGWQVETPKGKFEAGVLVNATGAWAGEVAKLARLEVPVFPVRRLVFMTGPTGWAHFYPLNIDAASGFYMRSEDPQLLFGCSNPAEPPSFTTGID